MNEQEYAQYMKQQMVYRTKIDGNSGGNFTEFDAHATCLNLIAELWRLKSKKWYEFWK